MVTWSAKPVNTMPISIIIDESDPSNLLLESFYESALLAYENKNMIEAISDLEKVLAINDKYKDVKERLGYYRQELQGIKTNKRMLSQQIQEHPEDIESRFDLADTLYTLGEHSQAFAQWHYILASGGYWGKRAKKMLDKYASSEVNISGQFIIGQNSVLQDDSSSVTNFISYGHIIRRKHPITYAAYTNG